MNLHKGMKSTGKDNYTDKYLTSLKDNNHLNNNGNNMVWDL